MQTEPGAAAGTWTTYKWLADGSERGGGEDRVAGRPHGVHGAKPDQ